MTHVSISTLFGASLLLAFAVSAQPPGDVCETALPLTVPGTVEGNTCEFENQYDEMCPYSGMGADIAFVYTPLEPQVLDFDLCLGITDYDTKLIIFSEVCDNNHTVACNDDWWTAPNYTYGPYVSRLDNVSLLAGTTYYIIVDGYGTECGNFTLEVTVDEIPAPPLHLTVRRVSGTSPHVVLRWNSSAGADLYYIYRDITPSPSILVGSTADTTYVDPNVLLDPTVQYYYAVTAVNQ